MEIEGAAAQTSPRDELPSHMVSEITIRAASGAPMGTLGTFELKRDCGSTGDFFLYFCPSTKSQIQVLTLKPTLSGGCSAHRAAARQPHCAAVELLHGTPTAGWALSSPTIPTTAAPSLQEGAETQERAPRLAGNQQGAITAQDLCLQGKPGSRKPNITLNIHAQSLFSISSLSNIYLHGNTRRSILRNFILKIK